MQEELRLVSEENEIVHVQIGIVQVEKEIVSKENKLVSIEIN